jgi:hypothetical protein
MNIRRVMLLATITAVLIAVGCAMDQSRLERDYGASHQLQIYNQTLNPEAEKNMAPVAGLDGRAAQAAAEKREKGFERQTTASQTYQLTVPGVGSGQ